MNTPNNGANFHPTKANLGSAYNNESERFRVLQHLAEITQTSSQKKGSYMNSSGSGVVPVSEYFGELTFGIRQMREKLPRDAYNNLLRTLEKGEKLTKESAESISQAIKEWAVSKGATHFCH